MAKLEAKEIQSMLDEASKALTHSRDQEMMLRLIASTGASEMMDWDFKLIATLLAKAGKKQESDQVIASLDSRWQRADAKCSVAVGLLEIDDSAQAATILQDAAAEATEAQKEGTEQDSLSAAAVLADIVELYARRGDYEQAEKVADGILHPIRQERAKERIRELRGDLPPSEEEEEGAERSV